MQIDFKVLADDQDITDKIKDNLIAITITDTIGDHADGLSIQISDPQENIKLPTNSSIKYSPMSIPLFIKNETLFS